LNRYMTLQTLQEQLKTGNWTILFLENNLSSFTVKECLVKLYENSLTSYLGDLYLTDKKIVKEFFSNIPVPEGNKVIGVSGDGLNHILTYGLCTGIADRLNEPYAYLHLNHHSDSFDFARNFITCGGFVSSAVRDSNAQTLRFIGSKGLNELTDIDVDLNVGKLAGSRFILEKDLREMGIANAIQYLLEGTPDNLYFSMDLDIMAPNEISTYFRRPYPEGSLRRGELLTIIDIVNERNNIIGADICGYKGEGPGIQLYQTIIDMLMKN
jgi:arginase family enzyme